ncbi:MAG TPA: hypothetical protein VF541_12750 [Longimicrobium sp.]
MSLASPRSARRVEASNTRCRSARFCSDTCTGCCVVFCRVSTHFPSSPRCFAASAAAAISASLSPASCARSSTTTAPALVAASSRVENAVLSVLSSRFSSRMRALSASDRLAPARTKNSWYFSTRRVCSGVRPSEARRSYRLFTRAKSGAFR